MATEISISGVRLQYVTPYGWAHPPGPNGRSDLVGHTFHLDIMLQLNRYFSQGQRRIRGRDERHVITWADRGDWRQFARLPLERQPREEVLDMPILRWREAVTYYDVATDGTWTRTHQIIEDKFEEHPAARTFWGFYPSAFSLGWADPWSRQLMTHPIPPGFDRASRQERYWLTVRAFRESGSLSARITDVPGMEKNPALGPGMIGGQHVITVTSNSRARVVLFDVGFSGHMVQAAQILETLGGQTTICKFVIGPLTQLQAEDRQNHARWREQHDRDDYDAAGNHDFAH